MSEKTVAERILLQAAGLLEKRYSSGEMVIIDKTSKCKREKWSREKGAETRAVWTTKTQTSSSTSALSSTFFLSLSLFHSHSLSPCPLRSLSFICRSERSPSRLIFHLAKERERSFKCPKPSLPNSTTNHYFSASLYTVSLFLLSFIHSPSVVLSHTHMQPHSVRSEGFQRRQFFQNTTSLFSVIKTPDPIKTVLELRHSGVELSFFPGNCRPFEKLSSHGLSAFLNQDCEMLKWHEIAPYMKTDFSSQQPVQWTDADRYISAPDLRSVVWFSRANLLKECADPGSEDLHAEHAHDSTCPTKFLCCARARFNPQQDVYTVQDCCMRTPCIPRKCTNTPTCAHSRTLESHLSSSVFSTTWCLLL